MDKSNRVKPILLAVGDAVAPTGFARVMHNLFLNLYHDFDIHQIGVNYHGEPHDYPWTIYKASEHGNLIGKGAIAPLIEKLLPDVIFLLNDIWVLTDYYKEITSANHKCPVIAYCPVDAGPVDEEHLTLLEGIDQFVVYTKFAANEVNRSIANIIKEKPDFSFPQVQVIAHGVDTSMFYPLRYTPQNTVDRQYAIDKLYGDDPEMKDAFIVLNANRNQPRKCIDITIKGFAKFAMGKPDNVKLHLHMGVRDMGWNIIKLAKRFGVYDRLIITSNSDNLQSVSNEQLNLIYNSAAIGVNTSLKEGWGLVAFEHAAAGGVQVVPNHTACKELWENHGLLINVNETLISPSILTDGFLVSDDHLALQLEYLYTHPSELNQFSNDGIRYVNQSTFQWRSIAGKWKRLIEDILSNTNSTLNDNH